MNNIFENKIGFIMARKEATLDANNNSAAVNLFKIHGTVEVAKIFAVVSEGAIINLTDMSFDAYDGSVAVALSNGDAVLSGANVGSFVAKTEDAGETLSVNINDQVRLIEDLDIKISFQCFILTQKLSTDTFIRLQYTTNETPIAAKIKVYVQYYINGGILEAV